MYAHNTTLYEEAFSGGREQAIQLNLPEQTNYLRIRYSVVASLYHCSAVLGTTVSSVNSMHLVALLILILAFQSRGSA